MLIVEVEPACAWNVIYSVFLTELLKQNNLDMLVTIYITVACTQEKVTRICFVAYCCMHTNHFSGPGRALGQVCVDSTS